MSKHNIVISALASIAFMVIVFVTYKEYKEDIAQDTESAKEIESFKNKSSIDSLKMIDLNSKIKAMNEYKKNTDTIIKIQRVGYTKSVERYVKIKDTANLAELKEVTDSIIRNCTTYTDTLQRALWERNQLCDLKDSVIRIKDNTISNAKVAMEAISKKCKKENNWFNRNKGTLGYVSGIASAAGLVYLFNLIH